MRYTKHYSSPTELLTILQDRGLDCSDIDDAESILRSVGYYRLSGYLYPFLKVPKSEHRYKSGSTLGSAVSLYEFDREFLPEGQCAVVLRVDHQKLFAALRALDREHVALVDFGCDVVWVENDDAHVVELAEIEDILVDLDQVPLADTESGWRLRRDIQAVNIPARAETAHDFRVHGSGRVK